MSHVNRVAPNTVLVVDDQNLVRDVLSEMLADADYITIEAATTEEALFALDEHPEIAVILADVSMPGLRDGCALAHEVRKRRPDVRVILTSGKGQPSSDDLPDGVLFIPKPVNLNVILNMVGDCIPAR